jgi:drug/metabolite transporter (DMT)-like permease
VGHGGCDSLTDVSDVNAHRWTDHRRGQAYIVAAALAWSTAGALQRELRVDTATQIAGRAVVAAIALTVLAAVQERGQVVTAFRSIGKPGLSIAVCMAGASACFIFALNRATVASVLFMQALSPFVAILLAWMFLRERASRRTWIATAVALFGVALMVGGPGRSSTVGIIASFVMTALFAVTIVITRHSRQISMTPAVALGQIFLVAGALPFANFGSISRHDLVTMVALGVLQTGLGSAFFVIGARLIPAAEVALITLLEVILGPLWVWLFHSERPSTATLLGGVVVLVAVVVQTTEPNIESTELAASPPVSATGLMLEPES